MSAKHLLALVLLLVPLAESATAQCVGPDGFSGPCCSSAAPNWPLFPGVSIQGQSDCWTACGPPTVDCIRVDMSPPFPTGLACGSFFAQFTTSNCSFVPELTGLLDLTYMRTWDEEPIPGQRIQVWRFHAKIDMSMVVSAPPFCGIPACVASGNTAFYYGYVDYAFDCVSGVWEDTVVVLFHNCDPFVHDLALSAVPGVYHPGTTFALVAPDTSTNPFVPAATPVPLPAALVGEAMRENPFATPPLCLVEEPMAGGLWLPIISGCLCPLALAPAQNTGVHIEGGTVCGSSFFGLNFWPNLPWFEFVTTSLGTWTTSASYPGPERASVGEGLNVLNHGCALVPTQTVDIVYGSITEGGYPVVPMPPVPLTQIFVDLASNYTVAVPGPYLPPYFGLVRGSDNLIYFNL